jgi:hypothetical protein
MMTTVVQLLLATAKRDKRVISTKKKDALLRGMMTITVRTIQPDTALKLPLTDSTASTSTSSVCVHSR